MVARERQSNQEVERVQAAEGFSRLLTSLSPEPDSLPTPQKMVQEFHCIASWNTDPNTKPLLDAVLDTCHNAVVKPPTYTHQLSDLVTSFRKLDEAIVASRKQKTKTIPAVITTVEHIRSQQVPDSIEKVQAVLKGFGEIMGAFGLKSSLDTQVPIDDETLKRGKEKSASRSSAGRVERPDNLHPEANAAYNVYAIRATEYPASPPTLSQDATSVRMEIPTTTASERNRADSMMFQVSLLIEEQPRQWRKVSLDKPVAASEYDPERHIPSQMLDFWTNNLPPTKVHYAIAVEAVPWGTQQEHADTFKKVYVDFAAPETEDALINGLQGVNDFDKHYEGNEYVSISKYKANSLLEELRTANRTDILSLPVSGSRKWTAQVDTYYLSYCIRIGTIENPGQAIPLKVLLDQSNHIGYELMSVPTRRTKTEEDKDESAILQALQAGNSSDQSESPLVPLIFTSADTDFASQVGDGDQAINARTSSRELFIQPLARHEVLREGEGWTGNVIQVVPNLNHRSQSVDREEKLEIATFEDLLKLYASKDSMDMTPILLKAPKIVKKLEEARRAARDIFRSFGTTKDGFRGFDSPTMYSLGLPTRGMSEKPTYTGAITTLGKARDAGESKVGRASVLGQFRPVIIRLVAPVEQP